MTYDSAIYALVACEESQEVTIALRDAGIIAYSCDILPCSGGHPEWHIQGDVKDVLKLGEFTTQAGTKITIPRIDLLIAHPVCTYLCNSGVRWLHEQEGRWEKLVDAAKFFRLFLEADVKHVAVENPIPHKYAVEKIGRSYDQCIQPYQFGHPERKATCFWLKNLPELQPTKDVKREMEALPKSQAQRIWYASPGEDRAKERSKTFKGIAKAMAEQWGRYVLAQRQKEAKASGVETLRTPPTSELVGIRAGDLL